VKDLKINLPDTFVSFLLVVLSLTAVFFLALLQVLQAIWGKRIEERIVNDQSWLRYQSTWCTIHERPKVSRL
jgi:hypothetical protein